MVLNEKKVVEEEPTHTQKNMQKHVKELEMDAPTETLDKAIFYLNLWMQEAQGLSNGPLVRLLKLARAEAEAERKKVLRHWRKERMSAL
jgi:hypothetical protein